MEPASYSVIRRLAVGGTCELDLVETRAGRRLVRKRPLSNSPPIVLGRLLAEGRLLSRIDSPHVLRAESVGLNEILLEALDGLDLDQLTSQLRRRGETLPPRVVWTIARGVGLGLSAIHAQGKVHADLGPSNVMLTSEGRIVVIDLGSARSIDEAPPSEREGTLAYQPPEQLRGQAIDPRADLYALGLIAYELITGVLARPAGMIGAQELLEARRKLPKAPSAVRPEIGPAFDEVLLWALEPQAAARPATIAAWLARLPAGGSTADVRDLVLSTTKAVIPPAATAAAAALPLPDPEPATVLLPRKVERSRRGWLAPVALIGAAVLVAGLWLQQPPQSAQTAPVVLPEPEPVPVVVATPRPELIPPVIVVDAPEPAKAPVINKPPARRVVVRGPVTVQSGGQRSRAPWTSGKLGAEPTMFELSEGDLRALIRIEANGPLVSVTIGAPPGTYYQADCEGQAPRPTPLIRIPLGSRLACQVGREDGANLTFEIRRIGD